MKRILTSLAAAVLFAFVTNGQNVVFVNTEKILSSIGQYTAAQDELSALSEKYKSVIETEIKKIDDLYQKYQNDKSYMNASQRKFAEDEIIAKEKVVKEKQEIYFGENGILAKKSEELLNPVKTKVDKAVKYIVEQEGGIDMVVDLAAGQGVIYYNEKKDLTEKVIEICKLLN